MHDPDGQAETSNGPDEKRIAVHEATEQEEAAKSSAENVSKNGALKELAASDGVVDGTTTMESAGKDISQSAFDIEHAAEDDGPGAVERAHERAKVENEASEHLARRAAEMSMKDDQPTQSQVPVLSVTTHKDGKLPATPPPPPPPEKDGGKKKGKAKQTEGDYSDGRHPNDDVSDQDVPAAPQGSSEQTGAEIQNIMDQFREGLAPGEQEIMSPRLERQQPILHLPPRSSSLEPKDEYTIAPHLGGEQQQSEQHSPAERKSTISGGRARPSSVVDDTSSIASRRTSIFQPPPPSPDPEPALPFDFHRFLEQLRHRTADPVARFLRSFLQEFSKKRWMAHEQVKIVGDFLEFISKKMAQCEVWRTVSDAEFDNAREGMEKLVMNRLYTQTFSPAIPSAAGSPRKGGRSFRSAADAASQHGPGRRGQHQEDVERDDVIAQKMKIYGWIKEEHLDIKPIGDRGRKFLTLAQQELLKINSYRAPRDKVICVLNCCKVIFGFLKNSKADQSADAFVPLLIYTVLRARPEHLVSNVQYIWRFRNQDKLGGEAGYYMSSLMGVVTFVENLDRTMITISDEEFERHVEQAVSAIAEGHKAEEYEEKTHNGPPAPAMQHLSEKSALSIAEVTPRNSMDAEQSSPRKNASQRLSEKSGQGAQARDDDDTDAVTGLFRTIQKPLSSIGRMFSDDAGQQQGSSGGRLKPGSIPLPSSLPKGLSPTKGSDGRPEGEGRSADSRRSAEQVQEVRRLNAEDAAARQESSEEAQVQRSRARGMGVVVE